MEAVRKTNTDSLYIPGVTFRELKARIIKEALEHHGGNKTRAAEALDISLRSFRTWSNCPLEDQEQPE